MSKRPSTARDKALALSRLRLSLVAIFAVAALVVAVAALLERTPAQAGVTLVTSEVAFTLADRWTLYDLRASSVNLSGIRGLSMEVASASLARRNPSTDAIVAWSPFPLRGRVVIQPQPGATAFTARLRSDYVSTELWIEPNTTVRIASIEAGARRFRIEAVGGQVTSTIDVGNTIELHCTGCVARPERSGPVALTDTLRLEMKRRQVVPDSSGDALVLSVERMAGAGPDSAVLSEGRLDVHKPVFHRVVGGRFESTLVEDGKVTFKGLKSAPETIRRGDFLRLECEGPGELRSLQVERHLKLELECPATTLRTGTEHSAASRLPSYLRWWYTNDTMALVIGAVLSLGGTILVVLQRLGLLPKP